MGRSILTLLLASSVGIGGTGSQGEEPVAPSPAESVPEQPASPSMDGVATHTPTLFDDMGNYRREITTDSENAQRWFDQGLEFLYGFNHDEAVRSFGQALKHDPDCAMAWWGIAYARGPHINNPVMTEALGQAVEAWSLYQRGEIQAALALIDEAASLEESMDKHPTTPGEVLPVRELHGDMLLEEGRIDEAREAFERSLERTPNRRNALKGIERAIAAQ